MALTTRIKDALSLIMDATPDSFTLDKLYTDLACMALIRALPVEEYSQFRSMLLMRKEITLQDLQDACRVEQDNRKPSAASANFVKASSSSKPTPSASKYQGDPCTFCNMKNHSEATCFRKRDAAEAAKKDVKENGGRKRNKGKQKANEASTAAPATPTGSPSTQASSSTSQSANSAESALQASPHPLTAATSISDWNADTGATSHMTPNLHWFSTYTPHRVPIKLANDCIVYSAGIGSVHFEPVVNGKPQTSLSFSNVLHVPDLRSNLLSVLFLT